MCGIRLKKYMILLDVNRANDAGMNKVETTRRLQPKLRCATGFGFTWNISSDTYSRWELKRCVNRSIHVVRRKQQSKTTKMLEYRLYNTTLLVTKNSSSKRYCNRYRGNCALCYRQNRKSAYTKVKLLPILKSRLYIDGDGAKSRVERERVKRSDRLNKQAPNELQ